MKNAKPLKVVALVASLGLMGAYVGHRALQAAPPKPTPPPAKDAVMPPELRDLLPVTPPHQREMFAGSKSMVDVVTVDDLKDALSPDPKKPASGAPTK